MPTDGIVAAPEINLSFLREAFESKWLDGFAFLEWLKQTLFIHPLKTSHSNLIHKMFLGAGWQFLRWRIDWPTEKRWLNLRINYEPHQGHDYLDESKIHKEGEFLMSEYEDNLKENYERCLMKMSWITMQWLISFFEKWDNWFSAPLAHELCFSSIHERLP